MSGNRGLLYPLEVLHTLIPGLEKSAFSGSCITEQIGEDCCPQGDTVMQPKAGPDMVKEINYIWHVTLGLTAEGLWKMHHWNNQRRAKEFNDTPEKGEISVVVEEE